MYRREESQIEIRAAHREARITRRGTLKVLEALYSALRAQGWDNLIGGSTGHKVDTM